MIRIGFRYFVVAYEILSCLYFVLNFFSSDDSADDEECDCENEVGEISSLVNGGKSSNGDDDQENFSDNFGGDDKNNETTGTEFTTVDETFATMSATDSPKSNADNYEDDRRQRRQSNQKNCGTFGYLETVQQDAVNFSYGLEPSENAGILFNCDFPVHRV